MCEILTQVQEELKRQRSVEPQSRNLTQVNDKTHKTFEEPREQPSLFEEKP